MLSQAHPIVTLTDAWYFVGIAAFLFIALMVIKVITAKPKIMFGTIRIGAGDGQRNHYLVWYLPIFNESRLAQILAERDNAKRCRVEIVFFAKNKLLGHANYWNDFPTGMLLTADSNPKEIALVYKDGMEISLAGEDISTKPAVPPYQLPLDTDITATIAVMSRKTPLAKTNFKILVTTKGAVQVNPNN